MIKLCMMYSSGQSICTLTSKAQAQPAKASAAVHALPRSTNLTACIFDSSRFCLRIEAHAYQSRYWQAYASAAKDCGWQS